MIQEPGSRYVCHITPDSGAARDIVKGIFEFLEPSECLLIAAVGVDGTAVNTGIFLNKYCAKTYV